MKQLFQISPEKDIESMQPVLSMRLGAQHCCFAITDHTSQELKQLSYYTADEVNENCLVELFSAHPELNKAFYKILVCYDHRESSLMPLSYYRQQDKEALLETLFGVNNTALIVAESITDWQLYNVYAVPKDVHAWVSRRFAAGSFCHQYSVDLKNSKAAGSGGRLRVDFRNTDLTVLATGNSELLLEQTFAYSSPEDVIYYLLRICRQFGLSPKELEFELSGLIDQQSALYNELHQYFLNVNFRGPEWSNAHFEYPAHFFTSLNDLSRCAS